MKNTEEKTILLIEDNPGDIRLIIEMLKEITSFDYKLIIAETLKDGCEQIKKNDLILILLDLNLPDSTGKQTFDTVMKFAESIPVVSVSGLVDAELSLSLIKGGAQDYLTKKDLNSRLLEKTIQFAIMRKKAEGVIKLKNEDLIKLNSEKDKFFSIIAHDLRSPFTTFLGFTEMMVKGLNNMSLSELQNMSGLLNNSARNLYGLLTNLLEWSLTQRDITEFNPKNIPVADFIYDSIDLYTEQARLKEIEIDINIPENVTVFVDKNMMETVMRNLLSNALKFTNSGGKIIISAVVSENNTVEVKVKDSGIGMDKDLINDLFKIGKKTNYKGTNNEPSTGLGLYLCKEYVEKHKGNITVLSEEGIGSEFIFSLLRFPSDKAGHLNFPYNE